jgi:hypothetical protein
VVEEILTHFQGLSGTDSILVVQLSETTGSTQTHSNLGYTMIGTTLGPYQIREEIGRGGMATVYRAYQPSVEREVAIKVIHERWIDDDLAHAWSDHARRQADFARAEQLWVEAGAIVAQLQLPLNLLQCGAGRWSVSGENQGDCNR